MAKLTKSNPNPRPSNSPSSSGTRTGNPTLWVGIILAIAAGLLFFIFSSGLQSKTNIMVASANIAPFTTLSDQQIVSKSVPSDSVEPTDLTQEKYNQETGGGAKLVNRIEILQGQRISTASLTKNQKGSLAVVGQDESVVAVSSTFNGIVGGLVQAGSVVNVYGGSGENNTPIVENAKVLAVGTGSAAASSVKPGGKTDTGPSSDLVVFLVVNNEDVGKLLGASQVSMAYNPRLTFDSQGEICTVGAKGCTSAAQTASDSGETAPTDSTGSTGNGTTDGASQSDTPPAGG